MNLYAITCMLIEIEYRVFLLRKYAISSQNSGITSYPTIHTHLHADQWNKGDLMLLLEQ